MALAQRGASAVPAGNPTTSFTVTIPSAVVADDLLFLTVTSRDSTGAGTLTVTDNDTGGNSWTKIGNSTDHKATLWYKRATSGTASKTVTVSNCVGSASGVLKAFSGGDTGATPYSNVVVETNASGDESHAGFTPANANSMLCAAVFNYANDNAVTSLAFATAGATTATEKLSTGGADCGNIFGHVLQSGGPSATGTLTWAQTNGTTYSVAWAIKPLGAQTFQQALAAVAVGIAALSTKSTFKRTLAAVSVGVASLASKLVYRMTLAASATGAASVATRLVMKVSMAVAAVGAATLAAKATFRKAIVAAAVGAAGLATTFIQGTVETYRRCVSWIGNHFGV